MDQSYSGPALSFRIADRLCVRGLRYPWKQQAVYGGRISDNKRKGTKVNPIYTDTIYNIGDFQDQLNGDDDKHINNKVHVVTYQAISREETITDEPVENIVTDLQRHPDVTDDALSDHDGTEVTDSTEPVDDIVSDLLNNPDTDDILSDHGGTEVTSVPDPELETLDETLTVDSTTDCNTQLELLPDMKQEQQEHNEGTHGEFVKEESYVAKFHDEAEMLQTKSNDYELLGYSNAGFVLDENGIEMEVLDMPQQQNVTNDNVPIETAVPSESASTETIPMNHDNKTKIETHHSKVEENTDVQDSQNDDISKETIDRDNAAPCSESDTNAIVVAEVFVHTGMIENDNTGNKNSSQEEKKELEDFKCHSVSIEETTNTPDVNTPPMASECDSANIIQSVPSGNSWPDLDDLVRADTAKEAGDPRSSPECVHELITVDVNLSSEVSNEPNSSPQISGRSSNSMESLSVPGGDNDVQESSNDGGDATHRTYRKKPGKNSPHIITNGSLSNRTLKSILSNNSLELHSPSVSISQENSHNGSRKHSDEIHEYKTVKFSEDTVFHENKARKYKLEKVEKINLRHIYHGKISSDSAMAKMNPLYKDEGIEAEDGEEQGSLTDDQKLAYQIALKKMMKSNNGKGLTLDPNQLPEDMEIPAYDRLIQRTLAKERRKLIIKWTLVILTVAIITAVAAVLGVHFKNGR